MFAYKGSFEFSWIAQIDSLTVLRRKKDYQKLDFNNLCALNKFSFHRQNHNGGTDAFV